MAASREVSYRPVAQLAEQRSPKPQVGGSIPSWPAKLKFEHDSTIWNFGYKNIYRYCIQVIETDEC
jgi:hypothetical protein